MRKLRRRLWIDPMTWPQQVRWALFAPVAVGVAAFVIFVYGRINIAIDWAPRPAMRGVLAACASVAFIFTAAYVAPRAKRLIAVLFALVPMSFAIFGTTPVSFLKPEIMTRAGWVFGTIAGLLVACTFRSEASAMYEEHPRSPVPSTYPFRPR